MIPDSAVAAWFDLTVTGIALGAGAGFIADVTGRSGGPEYVELSAEIAEFEPTTVTINRNAEIIANATGDQLDEI